MSKRKPISKVMRRNVWDFHVGFGAALCYCFTGCGRVINCFDFEAGHILAASQGGADIPENLVPICALCNRAMRAKHMVDFCQRHNFTPRSPFIAKWPLHTVHQGPPPLEPMEVDYEGP